MDNASVGEPETLRVHRTISRTAQATERSLALQRIADGVTEIVGFGVAAISYLREDGLLEVVAVSGNDEARELLLGSTLELEPLKRELDAGDRWGLLRFIPEGRIDQADALPGWVPDVPSSDDPDAWRALDELFAPLIDEAGDLVGLLSVDVPADGRRPGPETRQLLERYAVQAGRAVTETMARDALAQQVRLSNAARTIIRSATAHLSLDRILEDSQTALIEGFAAYATWLQTVDEDGRTHETFHSAGPSIDVVSDELRRLSFPAARVLWLEQRATVASHTEMPAGLLEGQAGMLLGFLEAWELSSFMLVPVGVGHQCLGYFVLCRAEGAPDFTSLECEVALDIGHDLGRALMNAKLFEREQQLVTELTELDAYKSRLISTISHELRTPLTSVVGHAELLESVCGRDETTRRSLDAIVRNANRLRGIVEDLLLFSSLGSPLDTTDRKPVDLGAAVADALDVLQLQADHKTVTVTFEPPAQVLYVDGDPADLDRVCTNLLSNAIKYTPSAGQVVVSLVREGDSIVLTISDNGIGISTADQKRLFAEFFRSSNPVALMSEGTGLGLAIVDRIVGNLGGTITVASRLDEGSAFRVTLPAA